MKILTRLYLFTTAAATGLVLAATGAAAAPAVPGAGHGAAVTSGTKLWEARYAASGCGAFSPASAVSPDGSALFLTGGARRKVHESGAPSGAQLWAATYQPPPGLNVRQGTAAAGVSPDGTAVYITGSSSAGSPNTVNYTTIAYRAANGQSLWLSRYKGPRNFANANALAVSPKGQGVFVTGDIGVHDGCCNFGTVAYQP